MMIQAMAVHEPGGTLAPWEYRCPDLGPNDCLIQVETCGICHSDLHMVDNDWGISSYPLVPGHEVVGKVVRSGEAVKHLQPGDRVGVGWQRSACLACRDCLEGNENLCTQGQGVISHGYGGFADHLVMDSRFCFLLPREIPAEKAGPLLCGGITVYSALKYAGMGSGLSIGVIGLGGLGHMAVLFASRLGNRVTVFTTSQDKVDYAKQLGACEALDCTVVDVPEKLDRPLQILINTVPHHLDWNAYLNLLDSDGVLTFVGVPGGAARIDLNNLLFKRRRIMASPIGGRADILAMLELSAQHQILPVVEPFSLTNANQALDKLRENRIRYRAVLHVSI